MTCREFTGIAMLCMMFLGATLNAQIEQPEPVSGKQCTVTTQEGLRLEGTEVGWDNDTLILQTNDGVKARIPSSSILALARNAAPTSTGLPTPGGYYAGSTNVGIDTAPDRSRKGSPNLFLVPTAYPEGANDIRLGLYELLFANVSYGIAGFATIQGGSSLFPAWELFVAHITAKVSPISGDWGAIAFGGTFISYDEGATTNPFALATFNLGGRRGMYLTAGATYQTDRKNTIAVAGLDIPLSQSVRFVTEMLLTKPEIDISYVTPGVRFHTGNFDLDAGLMLPLNADGVYFLPWLGASVVL
jgi:hypothetical protein